MTIDDIRRLRTIIKTTTAPLEYVVCMYGNLRDGQYRKVNENYITFVTDTYDITQNIDKAFRRWKTYTVLSYFS